eukprot:GHVU01216380.1.p2 GENE.GHVU01216380.1~~GHVU01216380.1.p2  ORF type:complete len:130 (+),score=20.22 GHVU01216380.1:307-696(+)
MASMRSNASRAAGGVPPSTTVNERAVATGVRNSTKNGQTTTNGSGDNTPGTRRATAQLRPVRSVVARRETPNTDPCLRHCEGGCGGNDDSEESSTTSRPAGRRERRERGEIVAKTAAAVGPYTAATVAA